LAGIMNIAAWLRSLGLERYEAAFRDNEIDGTVLPSLTAEDLKDLGVAIVGHRRKLLDAIAALRADASAKSPPAEAVPVTDRTAKDTAERRQVTVMFCDLVGSTSLSARLDPEDLREVIAIYHKCAAETVRRFGGFVSQYLGDGVLVYFGYPQAHEDDAERTVRAALELIAAVAGLNTHASLQTRVGIATGLVVVGDLVDAGGSQERGIIGETPNLAARLQGLAEPNMVVIAESTRRLLGNLFEFEDLGAREVKGIAGPIRAWAALRASSVESRFEALRSRRASLIGRDEEMELLLRRWSQAKAGDGRIVLISAEPGIGKSRLTEAVEERIAQESHRRLRYFCSPHHQDSAFYPFIGHLEHAAGFAHDDDTEARQWKLTQFAATIGVSNSDLPLLADLLSLAGTGSISSPELTPQRKKEKTFELLLRALETIARQQPLLMVFEDVHWIDPTSRELLDLTLARIERLPILLIATFRPEFQPPWIGQPHVTMMALPRLGRRDGAALVSQLAGNAAELPADLLDEIIERTDGVPLFIEEVTTAILEAAEATGGDAAHSVASAIPSRRTAVPATLQASLLARLDRLGSAAREMAQAGAAIGREFSYDIVSAATERPAADVQAALDRLVHSGLVFQRGTPPAADYQFKHALVQDTAYGTLLRGPRQALHGRIATAMENRTSERMEREPEILAYHWTQAGNARRAVGYWLDAGRRAAARSANHEAVAHLSRGTEMVASLPEDTETMRLELALQLTLGPAVMSIRGFAAREAQVAYRRARELAETLGDSRSLFTAIWGLWLTTGQTLEIDRRGKLVDELFRVAGPLGDTALELQAHHAAWTTLIFGGDLVSSREHIRRGLELYDRKLHGDHAVLYGGHDPAVCGTGQGAMALWMLGYPDQAVESSQRSIVLANNLAHQPSVGHALWYTGVVYMMRRDVSAVLRLAEQLVDVSRERGLAHHQAIGGMMRGWARARSGAIEDGLAEMRAAIDAHRATARVGFFAAALAETELLGGHIEEAASALALAVGTQAQESVWASDISAVTGDLRLAQSPADLQAAEQMYNEAISIARDQNAKSLELRAALRLARLRQRQGRAQEAVHLVQPIYSWFTEGLDTADLKEARELLEHPA
jgi:class 3 adenylate cyclase